MDKGDEGVPDVASALVRLALVRVGGWLGYWQPEGCAEVAAMTLTQTQLLGSLIAYAVPIIFRVAGRSA